MNAVLALGLSVLGSWQVPAPILPATEAGRLERVVVLGASMAAGFGLERDFAAALEASLRAPHEPVLALGDFLFFTSPLAIATKQVEAALEAEATLAVGLDFLFWFGYGALDPRGGPIERESERLELLEQGLELLEELECPLVLGDFPDMSAAVGRMISPAQMPEKATLALLSKRVREWAAKREHTLVLPLAELTGKLGSKQEVRIGRHAFPAGARLLQHDQLHPTLDGMAAMGQLVCDELVRKGLAREGDFEFELEKVVGKLGKNSAVPR